MYRFKSHITNPCLILVRAQRGDGSCAAVAVRRYSGPERCPPKAARPRGRRLLWGAVGATLLTGAAVVYAKSSPDARNWLESNVPWANDFVALVYQENTSYWKFSVDRLSDASTSISNFLFGKAGVSPHDFEQRSEQDIEEDARRDLASATYELPPPALEPLYAEEKKIATPEVASPATVVQTEECEPQRAPPARVTRDLVELERDMHESTKLAVDNYKRALEHCGAYNRALFKVVESSLGDLDRKHFAALQGARSERDEALRKAKEAAARAKCAIETLARAVAAGVQAPPETVAATARHIERFRADLADAEGAFRDCSERAVLGDKYWDKVDAARRAYKDELQMLFPGVDLSARRLELKGDVDLLLLYTMKQVQFLQNELAELQTLRELQISRALECRDESAIVEAKVEDVLKRERLEREMEYQKKSLEVQAEAERELRRQLKKQFEIQQEALRDALARKEKEVMGRFGRAVSERVERERAAFKRELGAAAGRLQAIEQTLKKRAAAEAEARRSQALWAAAEALHAATRRDGAEARLDRELRALESAGKDDRLVQAVLRGLHPDVRAGGVATERALRERFERLERAATRLALVGREGAALPVYFLSWLQARLLFRQVADVPEDELADAPTDFSALDAFDAVQRARYHLDRGRLAHALRYVNLLQGAPRAAARAWAEAARRHLEVRQAAEAVMAHASAAGLLHL